MFEKIESEMKNFIRKLESIKKEKVILELKCIIAKLKNSLGQLNITLDTVGEKISVLEYKSTENIQLKHRKENGKYSKKV